MKKWKYLLVIGWMMKKMKYKLIENYLDELIPNPLCELNYNSDYTLLISIVLSAQTTDKRVNEVTKILFSKYPTLKSLKEASIDDIKLIIKPIGNFNKKAEYIKDIVTKLHLLYNDVVPIDEDILLTFKGVGRKTINVFLAEYKNIPKIAVDTHVKRVSKRLNLCNDSDNVLEIENKLTKVFPKKDWGKRHLQMVLFGRYYCKAKKPECDNCKLKEICNYNK